MDGKLVEINVWSVLVSVNGRLLHRPNLGLSLWDETWPPIEHVTPGCHPIGHYWDYYSAALSLTHWGQVTHICIGKLISNGSHNGLSPGWRQDIWTSAGILLISPLETNFSEISIEIHTFSLKKMHWKMSSEKWQSSCSSFNVLIMGGSLIWNGVSVSCNVL